MVERILIGRFCHSFRYDTTTSDWVILDKGKYDLEISFAYLAATNFYYDEFGKLLKDLLFLLQVFDRTGHFFVLSYYRQYNQLVEGPPSVNTWKDNQKDDDVDDDDDNGGDDQDGNKEDVEDGDKRDGQDGNGEGDQDDDGGDGYDGDGEDNQDDNSDNASDIDALQSREAERGKSTSLIISLPVAANKEVGYTTSVLLINIGSTNIIVDVFANLFSDLDPDHAISIVVNILVVSAIGITLVKLYINPNTIFEE